MTLGRRRAILVLVIGILAVPLIGEGQQSGTIPRIGYLLLSPLVDPPSAERAAFLAGLRDLGYVEGRNIVIEYRSAAWNRELLPDLAAELVNGKVDLIVAVPGAIEAARLATTTIPIVVPAADPIDLGLGSTLARPGGNITGPVQSSAELAAKRLELLKQAIPKISRIAVLWNPANGSEPLQWEATQEAARTISVTVQSLEARDPKDITSAFTVIGRMRPDALIIFTSQLTTAYRPIIVEFATKNRLPTMFGVREDVLAGGLMSYAPDLPELFRRTAVYVDKILKGAKPGDLPMERPTTVDFVVNLKTAKALGLRMPPTVLLRANHIIE
jgi:putative tryptophan/tyrosine transport system substrate-binding protein